jgi:hypothetical protein
MDVLFNFKVEIIVLTKWSFRCLQLCWLLSLEWLSSIEHALQSFLLTHIFLVSVLGVALNHIPLKVRCVHQNKVFELGLNYLTRSKSIPMTKVMDARSLPTSRCLA